jgi:hypothetical protein
MAKLENIACFLNKKYGRLLIVEDLGRIKNKRIVMVICECGVMKPVSLASIKYGTTTSCGCLLKEAIQKAQTKHGLSRHPLKSVWSSIKSRCYNENDGSYSNYGGRGVKMCPEWESDFISFYTWCIDNGWKRGMDVDKDIKTPSGSGVLYSPEMCSIVSRQTNLRSKRNNHYIEYNGMVKCVSDWSDFLGVKRRTLYDRIKKGWPVERVLSKIAA